MNKCSNQLNFRIHLVNAANGKIGGKFSHEFHLISKHGEDDIYLCDPCEIAFNKETLIDDQTNDKLCPQCKNPMHHRNSIEIGHTFYLGTQYSERMKAFFSDSNKSKDDREINDLTSKSKLIKKPLEMCCFGIGVTRILSAFISQQTGQIEIDWPIRIVPYHILIIPPKKGSKENVNNIGDLMADNLSNALKSKGFDVLIDDRSDLTIGRRLIDSLPYGIPFKIVIGRESIADQPKFELITKDGNSSFTHAELLAKFDETSQTIFSNASSNDVKH